MGDRVCIQQKDGSKRNAMVTSDYSTYWKVDGFPGGHQVTYMDNRQKVNHHPSQMTAGECPYEGSGLTPPQEPDPATIDMRSLEKAIIAEVNRMRRNPKAYAQELRQLKFRTYYNKKFVDGEYKAIYVGNDRVQYCRLNDQGCQMRYLQKINEAISDLSKINGSLSQLKENAKLSEAARMLAADGGRIDGPGHKDSRGRGAGTRAQAAGYNGFRGECLNAGYTSAKPFIISFLSSTGHRRILINANINEIGVDTHYHPAKGDISSFIRDVIMTGYSNTANTAGSGSGTSKTPTRVTERPTKTISNPKSSGLPQTRTNTQVINSNASFSLEYVSGGDQSYGGGGMPSAMVFKIKDKATGSYVTNLRQKGLSFEVKANKPGKYDGAFNNLNNYCKNGDKACYGGYYYVPSNKGKPAYKLQLTVSIKKNGKVLDTYVVEQSIKGTQGMSSNMPKEVSGSTSLERPSKRPAPVNANKVSKSIYRLEYVSGGGQSYGGGGMPQAMVFKIRAANSGYIRNLRNSGLSLEVTANRDGKYDGKFNNLNNYCKNGDTSCFGGYYYVPSNRGKSPYTLELTVSLKKGDKVLDTYVVKQNIK